MQRTFRPKWKRSVRDAVIAMNVFVVGAFSAFIAVDLLLEACQSAEEHTNHPMSVLVVLQFVGAAAGLSTVAGVVTGFLTPLWSVSVTDYYIDGRGLVFRHRIPLSDVESLHFEAFVRVPGFQVGNLCVRGRQGTKIYVPDQVDDFTMLGSFLQAAVERNRLARGEGE
jgi:hypothetical protein